MELTSLRVREQEEYPNKDADHVLVSVAATRSDENSQIGVTNQPWNGHTGCIQMRPHAFFVRVVVRDNFTLREQLGEHRRI